MTDRETWSELRDRRMSEPGAQDAYDAARFAFELGATVRRLREAKGWNQTELARLASMTQSASPGSKPAALSPPSPSFSDVCLCRRPHRPGRPQADVA
jgi:hypothetical protein